MRAVIYARISRDPEGLRLGVDRQLTDCHALAASRGWTVTEEFIDNDISAYAEKRRPRFQDMLAAIRRRQVDAVVVYDLDRLTRRPIEIEEFITLADEFRLALGSVGGDVDLSTDNGRMYARIKGAVARAEGDRKSTRQKRANLQAVELGLPPGRRAFGYPGTDQRPEALRLSLPAPAELVAAEAAAVRALFAAALAGDSLSAIWRQIVATGLKTTRGTGWSRMSVRALLLNPRYAGLRTYLGEIKGRGRWEPLVDEEQWRAVERRLKDPDRKTNHHPTTARIHLLGGLALCGQCGNGTTCKTTYRDQGVRIYRCRTYAHLGRTAEPIDEYVTAVLLAWAATDEAAAYLVRERGPDFRDLRQEAATLTLRLDQLTEAFADGTLSDQQMRAGSTRLRHRLAEVEQALKSSVSTAAVGPLVGPDPAAAWADMNLDRRRQAINLVFRITLVPRPEGGYMSSRFRPDSVLIERR